MLRVMGVRSARRERKRAHFGVAPVLATRRIIAVSGLALNVLTLSALASTAHAGQATAERVHRDGGYASELPIVGGKAAPAAPVKPASASGKPWRPPTLPTPPSTGILEALSAALGALLQVLGPVLLGVMALLAVALVGLLIYAVVRALLRGREAAGPRTLSAGKAIGAIEVEDPLLAPVFGDPDELARRGDFEAAIRALLRRVLELAGLGEGDRSRTAREVLRALPFSDPRRELVRFAVEIGERVCFAGESPSLERYRELRTVGARLGLRLREQAP